MPPFKKRPYSLLRSGGLFLNAVGLPDSYRDAPPRRIATIPNASTQYNKPDNSKKNYRVYCLKTSKLYHNPIHYQTQQIKKLIALLQLPSFN